MDLLKLEQAVQTMLASLEKLATDATLQADLKNLLLDVQALLTQLKSTGLLQSMASGLKNDLSKLAGLFGKK